MEITYTGTARGAVDIVHATDLRSYNLASKSIDDGMSTSLVRGADGDVSFNAGYGYPYASSSSVAGYAPANTGYVPGQGFVTNTTMPMLPPLTAAVMETGVPTTQTPGEAIVPCPRDRVPTTVPEQAACAAAGVLSLTRNKAK